jgi:pimeloyl-ACP methyl ester carboxylesterase
MAPQPLEPPYYPIIYVRGYAISADEVEETVADPYMGFNAGSSKLRVTWEGKPRRHYFESPVVRLMKDHGYADVYEDGRDIGEGRKVPPRSIVIHRYYDAQSTSFGAGEPIPIETFARGLHDLIVRLRDSLDVSDADRAAFKVILVAHSMGGLVVRCFLQNEEVGTAETRGMVDKVFTYATPHNGIEFDIVGNVPGFMTLASIDNFNRQRMKRYLKLPADAPRADSLDGKFDPDRFFCLIGTNARDYTAANGWSARMVGPYSDGLVRIENAAVTGPNGDPARPVRLAPRAFVHRSHSGHYGIVNSEDGYQNLQRFLFGDVRVDGVLAVHSLSLPPDVEREKADGKKIRASYNFECVTRVRGADWELSRRLADECSTVFRRYGELFPEKAIPGDREGHDRPELFTAFLSTRARVNKRRPSLGFSLDLGVLVPEYEVGGVLFLKNHYAGGYLFRAKLNLEAIPPSGEDDWRLRFGFDSESPNRATKEAEALDGTALGVPAPDGGVQFSIPIRQATRPGIDATLVITARPWNAG